MQGDQWPMIFPLIIKQKIEFSHHLEDQRREEVCNLIVQEFRNLKVDEFQQEGAITHFKNRLFNGQGRYHILAGVDGGSISCTSDEALISFSTVRMAVFALVISLLFGITSASVWIGLVAFSLFYGLNVLVFLVRSLILKNRFQRQLNIYLSVNRKDEYELFEP